MTPKPPTPPTPAPSRDDLLPGRPPGMRRGLVLALIAHVLLIAGLTIGVNWHASEPAGTDAELWAAVPQTAAPPAAEPPPPPPPTTPVKPPPEPKVEPPAPPKPLPDAQIAIDREKKEKARKERERREEEEKELKERKEREKKEKEKEQLKREQQKQLQQAEKAEKAVEDKKKKEAELKKQQDIQRADAQREAQMQRILSQAGKASNDPSNGKDSRSAGPSASYGGKIIAAVRPNIVMPMDVPGNPVAEVRVQAAPDGTIISSKLTKSSGSKDWDNAVLRALERTGKMPRDTDGRAQTDMILTFHPQDF